MGTRTKLKKTEGRARSVRNFRSESAARKRERMRTRLLDATMRVCGEFGSESIGIEDVLHAAGVSRGTFYAHFESLYTAMAAVSERLTDELESVLLALDGDHKDPVVRIALSFQATLTHASNNPLWARAFVTSRSYSEPALDDVYWRKEFVRWREQGIIQFDDVRAAEDVLLGTARRAFKTLETMTKGQQAYIEAASKICLRGLGVPNERAVEVVRWASNYLRDRASKSLMRQTIGNGEELRTTTASFLDQKMQIRHSARPQKQEVARRGARS